MKITFFSEDVSFKLSSPNKVRRWIKEVIHLEKHTLSEISYIFCSDDYLHNMNVQYLNHDTLTDIITFDNSEQEELIEGDIFISVDRVKENATQLNLPFDTELHRVMIHGILHLCGYKDKTSADNELMRKKEDACLSLLPDL
ncbi:rRNA maturation RNase YbeY [Imperialibacter roseus]|uniref:Endoribonuclease YbeY n=1 Tax=Imperialibacter roseus TaxID=1324217 RepID=A0ABZ0IP13_9BACT|nr:rRNA maturation RNase YbeY [Imperialibacter roseus]WOK06204.1 rRNA maturation RNase YbeY [Imperialibacter roseus]